MSRLILTVFTFALLCLSSSSFGGDIIVIDDRQVPELAVGDTIRLVESGPAGITTITAEVSDGLKLTSSKSVRIYQNGKPLIGADTKEFEIKAEKKGKAKIKISVKNMIDKKTEIFEIDVEVK